MLMLSRKASEQIKIGKDVVVTVSRISGKRVHLAISAPQGVRILRGEIEPFETPSLVPDGHSVPEDSECRPPTTDGK